MPVIKQIHQTRCTAKRGKGQQHPFNKNGVAPELAEQKPRKHKAVFKPLVWPHELDEG